MQRQPPQIIADLVVRFERNSEAYRNSSYNETQLRREFLDPFFEALEWDVSNRGGLAEAYKDVIHEDAVKVSGATKAPDYSFRIGGARKFFVEAKKPAVNVKGDPAPAYQVRRYAWSAKLSLSIVTDFEEFAVYDCRKRPSPNDKPSADRVLYMTYTDYLSRWDEIASIFSKDAVLKGSFDKYAGAARTRGTATVDKEFLAEIEGWREALARNLAIRNHSLSVHDLNFAVQRTIDRIIFLRICEDRGVETYGELRALLNGENTYGRLRHLYRIADERYNSGLFHFQPEKGRTEAPDQLTPALQIDDKALKDIIKRLYYPESPYEFSVLPIEILGQVYEQFLGKVIRLTPARHAKIEEKPEVKKAGGVYYTPAYIVDYIVKQTVGKLCEGNTPKQISKLRILDPACGSGSFLIGAYAYLLNYHRDWYLTDGVSKHTKEIYQGAGSQWYLTTPEKKRILLNNIYGVDIDSQAVEVTKLSLLLKVLEEETQETVNQNRKLWRERALPDLGNNIKCGNSLIGPDYFAGQLLPDEDAMRRINPFDWNREFSEIMGAGGFDAVIGNPPWISLSGKFRNEIYSEAEIDYLVSHFSGNTYMPNMYEYFVTQGLNLTRDCGYFSFIVPDRLGFNSQFVHLRRRLLAESKIISLLYKAPFPGITADTLIFNLRKGGMTRDLVEISEYGKARIQRRQSELLEHPFHAFEYFESTDLMNLVNKTDSSPRMTRLDSLCHSTSGFGGQSRLIQEARNSERQMPVLKGSDIGRYETRGNHWFEFKKANITGRTTDTEKLASTPKILLRKTGDEITATFDESRLFPEQSLYFLYNFQPGVSPEFLLGVLNSRLLTVYYRAKSLTNKRSIAQVKKVDLDQLPIPRLDLALAHEKSFHDRMLRLVEHTIDLHKRRKLVKTPDEMTRVQRQIDAVDCEIDHLVYELFELTPEEISLVESSGVASEPGPRENRTDEDEIQPTDRSHRADHEDSGVATAAQYAGESGGSASEHAPGTGRSVDGVREGTGEYGTPDGPPGDSEEEKRVGSTRLFKTSEGLLPYSEVSERLAASLAELLGEIARVPPEQIVITPEWLCLRHRDLAGGLFPDWAGRYRDVNVQVGSHTPPPFYEVPGAMRLFCDDLTERLRHLGSHESNAGPLADFLAWVDWRFQWIHPFRDFNGRIGRVLLAAMLYTLSLPHVVTAPLSDDLHRAYLDALRAADAGDHRPLTQVWISRLSEAV